MGNTLIKDKTLTEYVPAKPGDPGSPGRPAVPERVTYENRLLRIEVPASRMVFNPVTGVWKTPLDFLREEIKNPGLSAAAAHYSEVIGLAYINGETVRYYVSWTAAWIERMQSVRVVYPGQPAIPPRPPIAGSPARTVYDMHFGWNASAQSGQVLPRGWVGTAKFTIQRPIGVAIGFSLVSAVPSGARSSFAAIRYGLVFSDGQISVREAGQTRQRIASMTGNDEITANVKGGVIEWLVNDSLAYRGPFVMAGDFVLDAVMYAGDDSVDSPALIDGLPSEDGADLILAPMTLALAGAGEGANLRLRGFSALGGVKIAQAAMVLGAFTVASYPLPRGHMNMRPLKMAASSAEQDAVGDVRLARLSASAEVIGGEGAYVPAYSIGGMGLLPFVVGGTGLTGGVIDAAPAMAPLRVAASQDAYGDARLALRPLRLLADVEEVTPVIRAQELVRSVHTLSANWHMVLVIAERIGAAGELQVAATVVQATVMERLQTQDATDLSARIVAAMLEQLGVAERHVALSFRVVDGKPVLVEEGAAWVVNAGTSATTRYESYSFNSFMAVGGRHFGARKDGVYLLEGRDDAGMPIEAGVALGKHDFGRQQHKSIDAVYAGVAATGELVLKIKVQDGAEFHYRARRVDRDLRQQRFDPGRGLRANYFEFDLVHSGGEFQIDNITFSVVASQRRT